MGNMRALAPVYVAKVLVGRGHKLFTDTDGELFRLSALIYSYIN